MRRVLNIAIVLIVATLTLASCFKDEIQGTLFKISVWSKNVEGDKETKTKTELCAYAFKVQKGSKWEVSTWDDAISHTITNQDNGKQLQEPDVVGVWNAEEYYQVVLDLRDEVMFMLIVDVENRVYATRLHETPINLHETLTELHLYACNSSKKSCGWDMFNPFPDEPRESLHGSSGDDNSEQSEDDEDSNERTE